MAEEQTTLPPPSLRTNLNDAFGGLLGAQKQQAKVETEAAVKGAQAEKEALDPIRQETIQRQQAASAQMADIGKQMAAPVNLPHETLGDLAQLGSLIAIAAPMLGNAGKQSATVALNSLTGMMEGYRLGRNDLFNKAKQEYDLNIKRLTGMMTQVKTELDNYFKEAALKSESALADVNVLKAQLAGGVAAAKLETGGYQQAFQVAADIDKLNRNIAAADARAKRQLDAQKGQIELVTDPKTGKTYGVSKSTGQVKEIDLPEGVTKLTSGGKGGEGGAAQQTAMRVMQQDVGNAKYNLQDLMDNSKETGKLPGGSVAFANYFKGDIKSDIIRYMTNQFVDSNLQANDALMLNLAFDIASAQSGGRGQLSDGKIRAVVAQFPLDEQDEKTKRTKWAALFNRVEEANNSMPENKRVEIPKQIKDYYAKNVSAEKSKSKGTPSEAEFLEKAAKANPNMTTEQLKAKYQELYGSM